MQQIGFAATGLEMSVVTVTDTATTVVVANNTRQGVVMRNTGANICYLGTSTNPPTAAVTGGWPVGASADGDGKGEAFALQNPSTSLEIQAICGAGKTTTLVVWS